MCPASPRILLLAFSGVRVVDPGIARLGMTLPGFAERARKIAALPSLGLPTLAAHTPAPFEPVYREIDELPPDADAAIAAEGFALVAMSALSSRIADAYALADRLRERGVPVAIGGLHVSAEPDEAARHADAVVVGEGEACWPALCEDLQRGSLRARYRAPEPAAAAAFDRGPVPRFDLLDARRYDRLTVQTMRGCPLDCSFCGASRTIAPFRRKPLDQVERELQAALRVAPHRRIELADDNTFADPDRGVALARLLARSGARWFTETDLSVADHDELLEEIARARCAGLLIGFESASRAVLEGMDSRGWKARRLDRHREAVRRIQAAGIPVTGCFVVGNDEEGPEVFARIAAAIRALDLCEVQVTVLTPFPGTPLRARLAREGRLGADPEWERLTLLDVAFEPARMSRAALAGGFRELVRAVYAPDESARRARRRRACLRAGWARSARRRTA